MRVYHPKNVQQALVILGLKKIDANTPGNIDKAITQFIKKKKKKISKGSHIVISKTDLETPDDIIKDYVYWKIMQNFIERHDIHVYDNYWMALLDEFNSRDIRDIIDSVEKIFTISARLDEFYGTYSGRLFGLGEHNDYYNYKFFISMDKNGRKGATDRSILMREYAIGDKNLGNLEFLTGTPLKRREKPIEEVAMERGYIQFVMEQKCIQSLLSSLEEGKHGKQIFDEKKCHSENEICIKYDDGKVKCESLKKNEEPIKEVASNSLTEQECIVELEQSLLSFLDEGKRSEQIKILFDKKNCHSKSEICIKYDYGKVICQSDKGDYTCEEYKSKCFSYNHSADEDFVNTSIKNNVPIKGCPAGNVWTRHVDMEDNELFYYYVPKNPACESITPKRVKDVIKEYADRCSRGEYVIFGGVCNEDKDSIIHK
jgi:hypothetical protein